MAYIMKDPCERCGGEVSIATMYDHVTKKIMVVEASCENCLKPVILPYISLSELVAADKQEPVNENGWLVPPPIKGD
jgi:hypothetical protein